MKHRIAELSRRFDSWAVQGDAGGMPPGEWDCLLGPVIAQLSAGAPVAEIAERISRELSDHYGLDAVPADVAFAAELRTWWDGLDSDQH